MKLILCPPGYIGVRIVERDIFVDKRVEEERGYALVTDKDAKFLLSRPGYEELPLDAYPRSLEWLERKSKMTLRGEGIISRATAEAEAAQKPVTTEEAKTTSQKPQSKHRNFGGFVNFVKRLLRR